MAWDPPRTSLRRIAGMIKARQACEQANQQMKEELGLDHFEGRSWSGLHHHAVLTMTAYSLLQHLRLKEAAASPPRSTDETPGERGETGLGKRGPCLFCDPPPEPSLPEVRRRLLGIFYEPRHPYCPKCNHCFRLAHPPNLAKYC